jgi:lipopolysaccharide transport system ATP-binding protein
MSSDTVLSVRGLSKRYQLLRSSRRNTTTTMAEAMMKRLRRPLKRTPKGEPFWALKDVNFEVKRGEVVGVIGRNGAGKSTLLKILSRITTPTAGEIDIFGRVGSLLEVGTGFHQELTGRENIFLNGTILGMTRAEIRKQFDAIVDFSGVEQFLDTPVKRYSSGMYVRLAFAVAAHLQSEVLIVDEVLAVGDAHFQAKCIGKMKDVASGGRTVLFVSHNMTAVESLCTHGIVMRQGTVVMDDRVAPCVETYLGELRSANPLDDAARRPGNGLVRATAFRVLGPGDQPEGALRSGGDYTFAVDYHAGGKLELPDVVVSFDLYDDRGGRVMLFRTNFQQQNLCIPPGDGTIRCQVRDLPLAPGNYHASVWISRSEKDVLDYADPLGQLVVEGGDYFGTGSPGLAQYCKVLHRANWSIEAN